MNKKSNVIVPLFAVGLAVLLIMRDVMGFEISKNIYFLYVVGLMAFATFEQVVHMLCFVFPLVCGLPGTYIMPCALIMLVFKRKQISKWQIGTIGFLFVLEVIASFWYPTLDIPAVVQYISFVGIMIFLIHDDYKLDYFCCVKMYLWGACLLCGAIIVTGLMTAPSNWMDLFLRGLFRFGDTHLDEIKGMSLNLNANSMAYYSATGMACGIFCAEKSIGLKRIGYIVLTVFMVVAGYLTVSRSWLLVGLICLALYLLSKLRTPKQFISVFLTIAIVFFIGSIYLNSNPELLTGFVSRLNEGDIETGNGRVDVFFAYINVFFENLRYVLLGAGVTQYRTTIGLAASVHNGTQQILVCLGVPGFVVFIGGLWRAVIAARDQHGGKTPFVNWLPLISVVLFVQTIQFLNPTMLMLPFVIGVYALKVEGNTAYCDNK